ncbi:MAG: hypothetical protein ACTSYD_06540 [Candidatus Heimdallarchaeaceae archaeon]
MKQTVKFLNLTVFSSIILSFSHLPSVTTINSVFEPILFTGNSTTDPSLQKVIDIFSHWFARSTFDQKMGHKYIDVCKAYDKSYTEGRSDL